MGDECKFSVRIFALQSFRSPECEVSNYAVKFAYGAKGYRQEALEPYPTLATVYGYVESVN
jgi:hypothetical protein